MAHQTPEQRALAQAGGQLLPDGIRIGGWTVRTNKGPIIGDKQLEAYSRALGNVLTLPEMLFGNSSLTLTHDASGTVLAFNALEALKQWKHEALPPLKVSIAGQWQAAREAEIRRQQAVLLDYDWTFTTPYGGSLQRAVARAAPTPAPKWQQQQDAIKQQQQQQQDGGLQQQQQQEQQDCTQQSSAAPIQQLEGLVLDQAPAAATTAAAEPAGAAASSQPTPGSQTPAAPPAAPPADAADAAAGQVIPEWQPSEEQIDRSLLMQREPILFYQDVPLYESELDDNGVCALGARVRVMAKCWFVLLRLFLRVDGTLVRLRETRLFCRLDDPQLARTVVRETKFSEGTYEQLRAAGAATPGSSFEDPDSAAAIFNAMAPSCTSLFELHKLQAHVGMPCQRSCHMGRALKQPSRRVACRALQHGPQGVGPPLKADRSSQSLLESGIRGSLAVTVAYVLHLNLFDSVHLHGLADDVATAATMAVPVMLLDAAMLLPRYQRGVATTHAGGPSLTSSAALQQAQDHTLHFSFMGSMPEHLLLGTAAQLSEELVSRALLLTLMADWLSKRFYEAGADDMLVLGSALQMPTADAAKWIAGAAICAAMATRYAEHSTREARRVRRAGASEAAAAAQRARLMVYEPQAVAFTQSLQLQLQEVAFTGRPDMDTAAGVAALAQLLLGARSVAGQATLFASFIVTGNLAASFGAGLLMRLASAACCEVQRRSRTSAAM